MKLPTWRVCLLLVLATPFNLHAQEGGLMPFEDRREGIMTLQAVDGALFDLVSVEAVRPAASPPPQPPHQVEIHASLPSPEEAGDLVARVRDPKMDYWMLPYPESLSTSNPVFAWSREDYLARKEIPVNRLRPLVSKVDETVFYPAWLVADGAGATPDPGNKTSPESRYRFQFDSRAAVYAEAAVYRKKPQPTGEGSAAVWEKVADLPNIEEEFGGVITVSWDGRTGEGPAFTGLYSLTLQGELESSEITPLNVSLVFYHHAD